MIVNGKNCKFEQILKVFKKILIKISENLTNILYYRFSLLAEACTVLHSLQIFRVSGGIPPVPPPCAATGLFIYLFGGTVLMYTILITKAHHCV